MAPEKAKVPAVAKARVREKARAKAKAIAVVRVMAAARAAVERIARWATDRRSSQRPGWSHSARAVCFPPWGASFIVISKQVHPGLHS